MRPLLWLNLLCLDAPLVAVTWQWMFAESFGVGLAPPARIALFFSAWLIYLLDRVADTFAAGDDEPMAIRHAFCKRHRLGYIVGSILILIAGASVAGTWLDGRTVLGGALLAIPAGAYLAINHSFASIWKIIPTKEALIGSLFASGTVLAVAVNLPDSRGIASETDALPRLFLLAVVLFACLCFLNCISIAAWERELDEAQGKSSLLTRWPAIHRQLRAFAIVLAVASLSAAFFQRNAAALYASIGVSALLLGTLDFARDRIPRDARTALADLVLLTPLIWGLVG